MTTGSTQAAIEAQNPTPTPAGLKVLVADKFESAGLEQLQTIGCRVEFEPDLVGDTLQAALHTHDPDVLVVRGTKVPAAAIHAADRLSLVVRAGAGYDSIDVVAASEKGIFVANCPGRNSAAVAELAWSLILSCDRRVPDQTADLRRGVWKKKEYAKASGLYGRTLGVVGLGRIGSEIASRGHAFGMRVVAWSRSLTQEKADELGVGFCANLINLAKQADVVSISVAATAETDDLIGDKFCAALKPGSIVVNTSRGSVLDEDALRAVIREKGIRAGLDVYAIEPSGGEGKFEDPIIGEPCVYGTHHVGASTDQAQQAIAAEAVRIIDVYQTMGSVPNCVNRADTTAATNLLIVRHLNQPGVLAHVFYTLGQAGINVEEMENVIYDGAKAACARIQLDEPPLPEHLAAIRSNDDVLSVDVSTLCR
jgi:D-3-phosphoglycerate dehydrogenase